MMHEKTFLTTDYQCCQFQMSASVKVINIGKGVPMDTMKTWKNCGHIRQVDSFLSRQFYSHTERAPHTD